MAPKKDATPSNAQPLSTDSIPAPVPVQVPVPSAAVPVQPPTPSSPAQSLRSGSNGTGTQSHDAREFLSNSFIRKEDLRQGGRRRLVIQAVEKAMGLPGRNGQAAREELVLVFHDDTRFGLRAQVNLRRLIEAFGERTANWIGQTIDLYFSPDVVNPGGGSPGGIRIQVPTPGTKGRLFTSELDDPDAAF